MTLVEARAAWVAANPFPRTISEDGVHRSTTQAEYDAMADDRAQRWLERVTKEALDDEQATRDEQAKTMYAALKAGTATNAQVQKVVAFLLRERFKELSP
jgi:hypothetical protein